jgi:putative transposase
MGSAELATFSCHNRRASSRYLIGFEIIAQPFVPKGRLIVARHFSGGSVGELGPRAVGMPEKPHAAHIRFQPRALRLLTKGRQNLVSPEVQAQLWALLGGIARRNGFKALVVEGTADHCHVLLSLPASIPLAKAVQLLKGASSKWMNAKHTKDFTWQEGYGAFTVSVSQKAMTIAYIESQTEHHKKHSFQEEFIAFLRKHGIEYDPKYVWG